MYKLNKDMYIEIEDLLVSLKVEILEDFITTFENFSEFLQSNVFEIEVVKLAKEYKHIIWMIEELLNALKNMVDFTPIHARRQALFLNPK